MNAANKREHDDERAEASSSNRAGMLARSWGCSLSMESADDGVAGANLAGRDHDLPTNRAERAAKRTGVAGERDCMRHGREQQILGAVDAAATTGALPSSTSRTTSAGRRLARRRHLPSLRKTVWEIVKNRI